jgi:hypothetical protein
MAGVLLVFICRSSPAVLVRNPTLPVLVTNTEFVGAPAVTVNGTFDPEMSSIENLFGPPERLSLAVSCQSLLGNGEALVSWNLMRRLFSLRRIVSKLNDSLFTQSRPMQALPTTMMSSLTKKSLAAMRRTTELGETTAEFADEPAPPALVFVAGCDCPWACCSVASESTNEPRSTVNPPDWESGLVRP